MMALTGPRMALPLFSALAAAAVFATPATATSYENSISVRPYAHITPEGTITLSGTYVCNDPSPAGAVQLMTVVVQDSVRLGGNADEEPVCDGAVHEWDSHARLAWTPGLHAGEAAVEARLQRVNRAGGIMPKSVDTLAEDVHGAEVVDHR
ncbi:DUF6299 family protein [Streptomyces sp. NPDC051578]|uniref:DUF6299 family protein n=1 Tax=Streptomyces sp. NPDC051578 TaxID=3365662 RepID=UPI003794862A